MTNATNIQLIESFYKAFSKRDYKTMAECYHAEVTFEDPAFGKLTGKEAAGMWEMLLSRSNNLQVQFSNVKADDTKGSANWVATYPFSKTGRMVVNNIAAAFTFKDGKIFTHTDVFDMNAWLLQAFGWKGYLFIAFPFLKNKFRKTVRETLDKFLNRK